MPRVIIAWFLTVLFVLAGAFFYHCFGGFGYTNYHFDRIVREVDGGFAFIDADYARRVRVRPVRAVYSDLHKMSHHVVIADEKWGHKALSERNVNKLIIEVLASDYDPTVRGKLLAVLGRWKARNFDLAHEDHNYVWEMLGGNIGEAKGVNYEGIPAWARRKRQGR